MTGQCSFLRNLQTVAERMTKFFDFKEDTVCFPIESKGEARAMQAVLPPRSSLWSRFGTWAQAEKFPVEMILDKKDTVQAFGSAVSCLKKAGRVAILKEKGKIKIGFRKVV